MNTNSQLSVKDTLDNYSRKKGKRRLKIIVLCGLLLIAVTGAAYSSFDKKAKPGPVFESRAVTRGDLKITVTATGNLEATNQVDVGSELSGIVTTVLADYNDTVVQGQPLAYLDDSKYRAAVQKSEAELASAKAGYEEALANRDATLKTYERYQKTWELTSRQMPSIEVLEQSEAEYRKAVATVASAKAAISSAEASLKSDQTDLAKTIIYSPTNGVVLDRDIDEGQTVAASLEAPVLFTVAEDLRKMELQVDIDEADVGIIAEGQPAVFTVDAYPEITFDAKITQVRYGAETNDGVVTYKAVLDVQNPDLLLRPGMTATSEIIVRQVADHLLLPNSALRFSPDFASPPKEQNGRSFLSSLLPGPPMHNNGERPAAQENIPAGQARIWIIDADGMPKDVLVKKIATDGIMTAAVSETLKEGMHVITSEMTKPQ